MHMEIYCYGVECPSMLSDLWSRVHLHPITNHQMSVSEQQHSLYKGSFKAHNRKHIHKHTQPSSTWHGIPHVNMRKLSHVDADIQIYILLSMERQKPAQMEWNETAGYDGLQLRADMLHIRHCKEFHRLFIKDPKIIDAVHEIAYYDLKVFYILI